MENTLTLSERDKLNIYNVYARKPIEVSKAEGSYIYAKDGSAYLDFLSGIAVNALGNRNKLITEAICSQLDDYLHLSNFFIQKPQVELAEVLIKSSGLSKVYFSNSGTESTEAAFKLARAWGKKYDKFDILGFTGGFHGRTYAPLSIMTQEAYKRDMGPFLDNCYNIEYSDINRFINSKTVAVVLEMIQGEGGIRKVNEHFLQELNSLKEKYNFLIIVDEIQTGIGRTGTFFAYEQFDIKPDIILSAKALGGGLPLGAMICSEELSKIWEVGQHGTTFGGNAVACAAGVAITKCIDELFLQNVNTKSEYFKNALANIKNSKEHYEIRGLGLMLGIKLHKIDVINMIEKLFEKNVLVCKSSDNVIRILPPLNVAFKEIDLFVKKLEEILNEND